MKKSRWIVGVIVSLLFVTGFLLLRKPRSTALAHGLPAWMVAYGHEEWEQTPIVDFSLPGIGRVAYPHKVIFPGGRTYSASRYSTVILAPPRSNLDDFTSWSIDHRKVSPTDNVFVRANQGDTLALPYVYGTTPRTLRLSAPYQPALPEVDLPPNGQPDPYPPEFTVRNGPYALKIKPRPRISPHFCPWFGLEVEGLKPGTTYLIDIIIGEPPVSSFLGILLEPGSKFPEFEIGLADARQPIQLVVRRTTPIPAQVQSSGTSAKVAVGGRSLDFGDAAGEIRAATFGDGRWAHAVYLASSSIAGRVQAEDYSFRFATGGTTENGMAFRTEEIARSEKRVWPMLH